jgi:hypothetical protein
LAVAADLCDAAPTPQGREVGMSDKIRKLKEDAARLIAKGKLDEACDCY